MTRSTVALALVPCLTLLAPLSARADAGHKHSGPAARGFVWFGGGSRLGVEIEDMTEDLRKYFGAPADAGVLVTHVEPDGPAAKAGLRAGDVIVEVAGEKVEEPSDVRSALAGRKAGEKVALGLWRDKARTTASATVEERKDQDFMVQMPEFPELKNWKGLGKLEALGRLDPAEKERLRKELAETRAALDKLQKRIEKLESQRK